MLNIVEENPTPMILKSIEFENFKCFKSPQKLDIKKLTIITGANSSGKSSILYSILAPLQTKGFPYQLSPNGKYVDMGDFKEISYRLREENISLNFVFTSLDNQQTIHVNTKWGSNPINKQPQLEELNVEDQSFLLNLRKNSKGYSGNFSFDNTKKAPLFFPSDNFPTFIDTIIKSIENKTIDTGTKEKPAEIKAEHFKTLHEGVKDLKISLTKIENFRTFAYGKAKNIRLGYTVDAIMRVFKIFESNSNYISSFRLHPERTNLESSKEKLKVKKFGESFLDQIVLWEKENDKRFLELITIMQNMKLLQSMRTKRLTGGRYEARIRPNTRGVLNSLNDVGFGMNQFLPIIVADLQLTKESTLLISQPETHLHPSAQSFFGDYIVNKIKKDKKNYIVETHSEYLLNKIRLAIVKGELSIDDLAVYHITNNGIDAKIHPLTFTERGNIEGAPDDFFETYSKDMMDIIKYS